ncbi:L,D-transpeptidase family protein [Sphingomonas sp.]
MGSAVTRTMRAVSVGLALCVAVPAASQQVMPSGSDEILLRNGQWTWIEDAAFQPTGGASGVTLLISIPGQVAYVYRDGVLIAASTVSTGKPGKATPVGEFTILQKRVHHRSNIYSNAPMPFMQRLTWTGIALHAGQLPGYPASHGCIRFPREFARRLFEVTALGTAVSVVDYEIVDPRVRRGAPRLPPTQMAKRADPPFLRADLAAFRTGDYDVVTSSNDVIIPASTGAQSVSPEGVVFAPMEPVVQKTGRRRR